MYWKNVKQLIDLICKLEKIKFKVFKDLAEI